MKTLEMPLMIDRGLMLAAVLIVPLVMLLCGCQGAAETKHEHEHEHEHEHKHEHEHEHEHSEHHTSHHKPQDFRQALAELERQYAEIQVLASSRAAELPQELEELVEIIRWLPEIAGDSDMPEADWNVVNAASRELLTAVKSRDRGPASPDVQVAWESNLRRLREIHLPAESPEGGLADQ